MGEIILKAEELTKEYRLGTIGHGTLREDLQSVWAKIRGREDPNSLVAANHAKEIDAKHFLALDDMNFEIKKGDRVGIIGRNGAGKSTLLKVLSRITAPSKGKIYINGRIGSLLEVGTGFHPELTGRENIYLNGTIMGMTKREIDSKLEEIIEFSGVRKFIDTPVKRYSSGMFVRLGFAVAAHLEPEILIVDEVLAVGDAEFQKKALGKMKDVSSESGRTVLFVSHNMKSVRKLCNKFIWIENGRIREYGVDSEIISQYLNESSKEAENFIYNEKSEAPFQLKDIRLDKKSDAYASNVVECDESIDLMIDVIVREKVPGLTGAFYMRREGEIILFSYSSDLDVNLSDLTKGNHTFKISIPARTLAAGEYIVHMYFVSKQNAEGYDVDNPGPVMKLTVNDSYSALGNERPGYFSTLLDWEEIK